MAIVIEEQKNRFAFLNLIIWLMVIGVIAAAVYYIFVKKPELFEVAVPVTLQGTQDLAEIKLDPSEVIQSARFQALKQYITIPKTVRTGRTNPFVSF